MLTRWKAWRSERQRKDRAIRLAVQQFRETRGLAPMGGHVLRLDPQPIIVRVMYVTDRVPPNRTWFAVAEIDGSVRELTFNDVADLELPWR